MCSWKSTVTIGCANGDLNTKVCFTQLSSNAGLSRRRCGQEPRDHLVVAQAEERVRGRQVVAEVDEPQPVVLLRRDEVRVLDRGEERVAGVVHAQPVGVVGQQLAVEREDRAVGAVVVAEVVPLRGTPPEAPSRA